MLKSTVQHTSTHTQAFLHAFDFRCCVRKHSPTTLCVRKQRHQLPTITLESQLHMASSHTWCVSSTSGSCTLYKAAVDQAWKPPDCWSERKLTLPHALRCELHNVDAGPAGGTQRGGIAEYLGHGQTRTVYSLPENRALKLEAFPGIDNNHEQEISRKLGPELAPEVLWAGAATFGDDTTEGGLKVMRMHVNICRQVVDNLRAAVLKSTALRKPDLAWRAMEMLCMASLREVRVSDFKMANLGLCASGAVVLLDGGSCQLGIPSQRVLNRALNKMSGELQDLEMSEVAGEISKTWDEHKRRNQDLRDSIVEFAQECNRRGWPQKATPAAPRPRGLATTYVLQTAVNVLFYWYLALGSWPVALDSSLLVLGL